MIGKVKNTADRSVYLIGKGEMMMEEQKQCCHKKKERAEKEYRDLVNRLSRIEGQVRGIKRMVEEDVYCTDILIQVSAVNAALNSLTKCFLQIISAVVWRKISEKEKKRRLMSL